MQLSFKKYFDDKMLHESDEEDYVPPEDLNTEKEKKEIVVNKKKCKAILDTINKSIKEKMINRQTEIDEEKEMACKAIMKKSRKITKQIYSANREQQKKSKKVLSFADKFYVLINDSFLQELEKKPKKKETEQEADNFKPEKDYKTNLLEKNMAIKTLLKSLGNFKNIKLSSILKSKYDWKKFISTANIEADMNYQRKDDMIFKKISMLNN